MMLSFIRALKFSLQDMYRNAWLSVVTVTILVLALVSINILISLEMVGRSAVDAVKSRVNINVFIKSDAREEDILSLKEKIRGFEEVKDVVYVSKNEALNDFRERHKKDPELLSSLKALDRNPLSPILIVSLKNLDNYDQLAEKIGSLDEQIIESRNFEDYKTLLEKINGFTGKVSRAGLAVSALFVIITFLLTFNSIRVAIYTHKREISIMRLVGASNSFIKMPFLISGVIYSLVGVIIAIIITYPLLHLAQSQLNTFFVGYDISLVRYFNSNFIKIFGLEFLCLAILNILASFMAVGKYSKG